jgi:hypothetical protein
MVLITAAKKFSNTDSMAHHYFQQSLVGKLTSNNWGRLLSLPAILSQYGINYSRKSFTEQAREGTIYLVRTGPLDLHGHHH